MREGSSWKLRQSNQIDKTRGYCELFSGIDGVRGENLTCRERLAAAALSRWPVHIDPIFGVAPHDYCSVVAMQLYPCFMYLPPPLSITILFKAHSLLPHCHCGANGRDGYYTMRLYSLRSYCARLHQ